MLRKIIWWEFRQGWRPYILFLLYFLLLVYIANYRFFVEVVEIRSARISISSDWLTPGTAINAPYSIRGLWWLLFPVVTGYAVLVYSYELDRGIIRAYLLSSVDRRTLFIAKLVYILVATLLPLILATIIVYALADIDMLLADPLEVFVNLPRRLLIYLAMLYIMLGLAVSSSVIFKKPFYAFVIPIITVYVLNNIGIPYLSSYIPPRCIESWFDTHFIYIIPLNDFLARFQPSLPSILVSTVLLIASYLIFRGMDIT